MEAGTGILQIIADVFRGDVFISGAPDPTTQWTGSDFERIVEVDGKRAGVSTAALGAVCRAMHATEAPNKPYSTVCGPLIDSTLKLMATFNVEASNTYDKHMTRFAEFENKIIRMNKE